jgi:GrpB-like predicted nucleotidyltransferase (UPF0157 family)
VPAPQMEHVGSTSVPGLGGRRVIDAVGGRRSDRGGGDRGRCGLVVAGAAQPGEAIGA